MKIVWCLGSEFSSDRNFGYLAEILNDTIPIASMYGIFTRMYHKNQLYQCLGIYIYTIHGMGPIQSYEDYHIWSLSGSQINSSISDGSCHKIVSWMEVVSRCFLLTSPGKVAQVSVGVGTKWRIPARKQGDQRDDDGYGSAGVCHEFGWVFFSTWSSGFLQTRKCEPKLLASKITCI